MGTLRQGEEPGFNSGSWVLEPVFSLTTLRIVKTWEIKSTVCTINCERQKQRVTPNLGNRKGLPEAQNT